MEKTMTEFGNTCPFCGHVSTVMADAIDVAHWQNGALVQDAMPYLSADEREILMTGICVDCWPLNRAIRI